MKDRNVFYDPADAKTIGQIKRVLEYINICPGFNEKIAADPEGTLKEMGLDIKPRDVSFFPFEPGKKQQLRAMYPESKGPKYADFINRKFEYLDVLKDRCRPENTAMAKWRDRQSGRCTMELGAKFTALIHAPFIYEIADGCSVGCKFCGLNAGRLKSVFRYNEENAKLFNEVIRVVSEVVGRDAGAGTMYFATEPLDNPDYELFLEDYLKVFRFTPQITTAASTRNIARMHKLLETLNERQDVIYRFSVTSLEMFETIMANFTPEELVLVELLPQFDEAPGNGFVKSGRQAERPDKKENPEDETEYGDTICCASGFKLNFCRKEISLITPTWASKDHPTGEFYLDKATFTDADDLKQIMLGMIRKHMLNIIGPKDRIMVRKSVTVSIDDNGKMIISSGRGSEYRLPANQNMLMYQLILDSCKGQYRTRREVVDLVMARKSDFNDEMTPETIFYVINRLWNLGILVLESGKI